LSILGFPNAKGLKLEEQNLGMLDMRLAVEWTRDNIANFGGDPKRISLMGQSAGAIAADHYNFAYPKDPIVSSFILHSGTATLNFLAPDPGQTNFTFVAKQFGCARSDAAAELECFRKVNASSITNFLKYYSQNATTPRLAFVPILDNHTLFKNHTARALAGNFSRKPALIGNTANEGSSFVLPFNATYGPGQARADQTTIGRFAAKATTFRYLYAGNFSTVSPRWWEGAFHSSDLPMIFGTYALARGPGTEFQKRTSEKMQETWVAFAEDPLNGLPKLGWNSYKNGAGEGMMFGTGNKAAQPIAESRLDQPCDGLVPNGKPPPPR
jgi:acetylcholinesterase